MATFVFFLWDPEPHGGSTPGMECLEYPLKFVLPTSSTYGLSISKNNQFFPFVYLWFYIRNNTAGLHLE